MDPTPNPSPIPAPYERSKLTGILLAGGQSSRMGTDKGLLDFRGKPLIRYGIELLSQFSDRILISTGNKEYHQFGLELVADDLTNKGPAAGIAAALQMTNTPWNLVIACDLPFLVPELISLLLKNTGNYQAVIPRHEETLEPLAALYHKDLANTISSEIQDGNLALHSILRKCTVNYLDTDAFVNLFPLLFSNLNTPGALEALK